MVQASTAFTLQAAAGGLLKVMEIIQVRNHFSVQPHSPSLTLETESISEQGRRCEADDILLQSHQHAAGPTERH